ncbi:MAG TPA: Cof-type HAD-IIB family hydrolase [Acidimicrobiales bacterium]|nr:MAG: haloacid dehalogenase [Actinobacteria bacterium 21-64-8]HQU00406.1 Cof-type HAD-IIB family hydrolase [Acidimicrobiales bacterium]
MVRPIKLVLSDVDGTLVTSDKTLTPATLEAVASLREAGVLFAITSARPPRGLVAFVEPLHLVTPLGAFNGATMILPNLRVLEEKLIDDESALATLEVLEDFGLAPWVYTGAHWYVRDAASAHVHHESQSCQCEPEPLDHLASVTTGVSKMVGVSDDEAASAGAARALNDRFGHRVSVSRSQSYFLDVTHPDANKGNVVRFLAQHYDIATDEIATIGDMHNDVSMFEVSGLSIAMGNALAEVQSAANYVTSSNNDEGFARAITEHVLA